MIREDLIKSLFERSYPTVQEHRESPNPLDEPVANQQMEIHATRSHFGELVVVAANTGRKAMPKLRFWANWLEHCFPELYGSRGWRTRFDGGDYGRGEPRVIVTLYYHAALDSMWDYDAMELTEAWALVQIRLDGEVIREHFMSAPWLVERKLVDDGLEAVHRVLMSMPGVEHDPNSRLQPLQVLEAGQVPDRAQKILRRWANHVLESFGQGPLLPKQRR
jgi:hypothetical protein